GLGNSYEKTVGENGHESLKKKPGFYRDSRMLERLGRVARRLVPVVERQDLTYHFTILDSDELNAFALPGGYVYVTKGLMKTISSDDELAGVVGHELGHVDKKHGLKQAGKSGLMALVIALMGANDDAKKFQKAAAIAALFANLKFSRDDEFEADRQAVKYTMKAGYRPDGLLQFFGRINKDGKLTSVTKYFSTHPPTMERIKRVQDEIKKRGGRVLAQVPVDPPQYSPPPERLPNPQNPPSSSSRPDISLKLAYEDYMYAKNQYEYKVSQGAPVEEVMSAFRKYQVAKERYFKLKAAMGR
ncbi:M48 family metalloprotease, partial [bacterium]|nr:M48 family metalloprotease [bacterium]